MSKMWRRADEWVQFASCHESVDHTLPPSRDGEMRLRGEKPKRTANKAAIKRICGSCPVRPECIVANVVVKQENSVWVAGRWLPDTYTAQARRDLEAVRADLLATLPAERASRPEVLL